MKSEETNENRQLHRETGVEDHGKTAFYCDSDQHPPLPNQQVTKTVVKWISYSSFSYWYSSIVVQYVLEYMVYDIFFLNWRVCVCVCVCVYEWKCVSVSLSVCL